MKSKKYSTVFYWLLRHKGHPNYQKVLETRESLRDAKTRLYNRDRAAIESNNWQERARHSDVAQRLREVFIPAMQEKLNQLIETP